VGEAGGAPPPPRSGSPAVLHGAVGSLQVGHVARWAHVEVPMQECRGSRFDLGCAVASGSAGEADAESEAGKVEPVSCDAEALEESSL
jgi:hypothetical protein